MEINGVKQFERRVGPNERPAMPPLNGFAGKFAPDGVKALGAEGPMGAPLQKCPGPPLDMERRMMM